MFQKCPFFSFSQSAPTVSVSRARETISRKKEEKVQKVQLVFRSASTSQYVFEVCFINFVQLFTSLCSLLRSRPSTLEMCFLGPPGEHILHSWLPLALSLKDCILPVPSWNLGINHGFMFQIATNNREEGGSGKPQQQAAGETGRQNIWSLNSPQRWEI